MTEHAADSDELPRAFLTVGGRTIARHQLDLALALDCRRVVCLARHAGAEHVALKRRAEAAGVQLSVVSGARGLAALVSPGDELVVLGDGLMAEPSAALGLLGEGLGVLVQPALSGIPAGFERIDATRAFGGAMRVPAALVPKLFDLPADYDVPSALMRIALQEGVATREVPAATRDSGRWGLVRDDTEAHAAESAWIAGSLGQGRGQTLGEAVARKAIGAYGSALLNAGSDSRVLGLGVALLLLLALGAGRLGAVVTGFALIALASLVERAAVMLERVERDASARHSRFRATAVLDWLIDAALVALASWQATAAPLHDRLFAPLLLVCLLRLASRLYVRIWARWLEDRTMVALILGMAAALGVLPQGVEALALVIAAGALLLPKPPAGGNATPSG